MRRDHSRLARLGRATSPPEPPEDEIIDARIWAGLHYRTADVQAQNLGRRVAHYMEKHYFQPLD